ncbi:hypothetical protein BH160DRAFT_4544 [Burkholderia sp. H160]|nr:hypothetical protein BH160DRAFT_4544 [Burkholderia sp. H160]
MDIRIVSKEPYRTYLDGIELDIEVDGRVRTHTLSCSAAARLFDCPAQNPSKLAGHFGLYKGRAEKWLRAHNFQTEDDFEKEQALRASIRLSW